MANKGFSPFETASIYLRYLDLNIRSKEAEQRREEQRVTLFLSLLTASIGLVALALREDVSPSNLYWVTLASLTALSLVGIYTLASIVWSNRYIEELNALIHITDQALKELNRDVGKNLEHDAIDHQKEHKLLTRFHGTFTGLMAITEALLLAAIAYTIATGAESPPWLLCSLPLVVFFSASILLITYSRKVRSPIKDLAQKASA